MSSSSSAVFYRFRSVEKIEKLRLPGSAPVRLFDIKKAIVKNSGLGSGRAMEFDLLIANEETQEVFSDETERIARNIRLVVKRTPAPRGQGLLRRIEREECKRTHEMANANATTPKDFYTIDSSSFVDEEDEFVTIVPPPSKRPKKDAEFEKQMSQREKEELSALQAITDAAMAEVSFSHYTGNKPPSAYRSRNSGTQKKPDADPELRSTEKPSEPRIVRGVPLIMKGDSSSGPIKVNTAAFQELKSRTTDDNRINFDTALILTNTQIPEYLACAVCNNLLSNALSLHWDAEGRSACEGCIRSSLTHDFRCPVTGIEGISPDDLHPNRPIQRAADAFKERVMKSAAEINGGLEVDDLKEKNPEVRQTTQASGPAKPSKEQGPEKEENQMDHDFGGDVFNIQEEAQVDRSIRRNTNASHEAKSKSGAASRNNRSSPPRQTKTKPYLSERRHGDGQKRGQSIGYHVGVVGGYHSRISSGRNDRRGNMAAGVGGDRRRPYWKQNHRGGMVSCHIR